MLVSILWVVILLHLPHPVPGLDLVALERVKFWCDKLNSQGCKLKPKCWLPGVVSTAALGASYLKPVEFCRCGADVSSQLLLRALQMITMLCQLV